MWSEGRTKIFKISLSPGQQNEIQTPYPQAKAIDQIPALYPASSLPASLTLRDALDLINAKHESKQSKWWNPQAYQHLEHRTINPQKLT